MCNRFPPNRNKFELVSHVLQGGRGLAQISSILKRMSNIIPSLTVNKSMGFHIHVDVSSFSAHQLFKLFKTFIKQASVIDTFMPPSRRYTSAESLRYFQSNQASVAKRRNIHLPPPPTETVTIYSTVTPISTA